METEWVLLSRRIFAGLLLLASGGYVLYTGEQLPQEVKEALDAAFNQTLLGIVAFVGIVLPIWSRLFPKKGSTDPKLWLFKRPTSLVLLAFLFGAALGAPAPASASGHVHVCVED